MDPPGAAAFAAGFLAGAALTGFLGGILMFGRPRGNYVRLRWRCPDNVGDLVLQHYRPNAIIDNVSQHEHVMSRDKRCSAWNA